jgi:cytochrome c553
MLQGCGGTRRSFCLRSFLRLSVVGHRLVRTMVGEGRVIGRLFAAGLWLSATAMPAVAQDAATIAAQGNSKGTAPCQACHTANGAGMEAAGFPRLAGLDAAYLLRQLDAFADGSRDNPVMKLQAGALSEAEREALARYFSRLPAAAPAGAPVAPVADPDHLGETLALHGRWSRQLPACVQCHGPQGVGVGANFPPLVGQPASYLVAQLKAFRQGRRHNDPMGLMRKIGQSLDDRDIDAVSHWFAAQPFPVQEARP